MSLPHPGTPIADGVTASIVRKDTAQSEDLLVLSRILGHASIATTASFYGHVRPSMLQRLAQRMDDLLRDASGTGWG